MSFLTLKGISHKKTRDLSVPLQKYLCRTKLDPNREINEAAQGDELAIDAYNTFHGYISAAIEAVGGRGILFDLHGQV